MVEWRIKGDGTVVEIFGSNDLRDWLFNFMTGRTIGSNVRVNRWDRYEALIVLRAIRGLPIRSVVGFSRGGAIAQIVAYELGRNRASMPFLTLFGSKRTGNRQFVKWLYRVTHPFAIRHRGDWVPMLPPWYADVRHTLSHKPWRPIWKAHTDYSAYELPIEPEPTKE